MNIVAWNIRSGGGTRVEAIYRQLVSWRPDIIALSEFRGTPSSQYLASQLAAAGWCNQLSTIRRVGDATNGLLIASIHKLSSITDRTRIDTYRWLPCIVHTEPELFIGSMHIPNRVSGRKDNFYDASIRFLGKFQFNEGLLIGDTNSGLPGIDEQSPAFGRKEIAWISRLERRRWHDGFRHLRPDLREYSWYSPNGNNGFRLDHAYLNPRLLARLRSISYQWGSTEEDTRREALSDHAALHLTLF